MKDKTAGSNVEALREMFAAFGLLEVVVSDNGPQLVSREFESFLQKNRVKHVRTAPYHPASNGLVERLVQTFKQSLEKQKELGLPLKHCVDRFLFSYRNTLQNTTGKTPAELFLKRDVRSRVSQDHPIFLLLCRKSNTIRLKKG